MFDREYKTPPVITPERQKELDAQQWRESPIMTALFGPDRVDGEYDYEKPELVYCYRPGKRGRLHLAVKEVWKDGKKILHTLCGQSLKNHSRLWKNKRNKDYPESETPKMCLRCERMQ